MYKTAYFMYVNGNMLNDIPKTAKETKKNAGRDANTVLWL